MDETQGSRLSGSRHGPGAGARTRTGPGARPRTVPGARAIPVAGAPPKPPALHEGGLPWVALRSAAAGPNLYKRMISAADPAARPGDLVAVYDKAGTPYGVALYNPRSLIALRMLTRTVAGFEPGAFFADRVRRAVEWRREVLRLDKTTDAYRAVYDQGDGLPGLVVDRYAGTLVSEFYSLGMLRQAERIEAALLSAFPGSRLERRASEYTQKMEGFRLQAGAGPGRARISENGVLFDVDTAGGSKTGFFCDQRDNRLAAAALAAGRRVLDVCSYTGGFGVYAMKLGGAGEAVCVELDPAASELGRRNANINGVRVRHVRADAFPFLRQMAANREAFGLVVLDPYKLIASREGFSLGARKYLDLNRLALSVVEDGGLLVTCSCSGLLPWEEFQRLVRGAAGAAGRRVSFFRRSGAGPDHPVSADCPEGEYLKVLWCRARNP